MKHLRVAAAHAFVDVVDDARLVVVGDDGAAEAPLVAHDGGEHRVRTAAAGAADAVDGGHEPVAAADLDGVLKGFEVVFAQALLGQPLVGAVAAGIRLVGSDVLDIGDDALFFGAQDVVGAGDAGKQRVFGVILKVSAAEGRTVQVCARPVPAVDAQRVALDADGAADLVSHVIVPGLGEHGRARVVDRLEVVAARDVGVEAARAVCIVGGGLADLGELDRAEAAPRDQERSPF